MYQFDNPMTLNSLDIILHASKVPVAKTTVNK